jgi:hypothetical protein
MLINLLSIQHEQYATQLIRLHEQVNAINEQSNRILPIMNELRYNMQSIYADARQHQQWRSTPTMPSNYARQGPTMSSNYATQGQTLSSIMLSDAENLMTTDTTTMLFSDIANPLNTECPISLEPFNANSTIAQINRCGHNFIRSELQQWFQINTRCPTCRTELGQPFIAIPDDY